MQKEALRDFYAAEARDRDTEQWLAAGGSARVPESRASHYFLDRKVDTALRMAAAAPASRVLEVGCSFGHQTFLLARRFAHVTGVDLSPESIELAKRRAAHWRVSNVDFAVADAERLSDLADGAFDAVFSFSTLRFCGEPVRALREMLRVLRPGGVAAVDFPNANCPWYGPLKRGLGISPHIHDRLSTGAEALAMMSEAGFRDVRCRYLLFTSKRVPDPLLPLFQIADAVGERTPGLRELSGIIMASGAKDAAR